MSSAQLISKKLLQFFSTYRRVFKFVGLTAVATLLSGGIYLGNAYAEMNKAIKKAGKHSATRIIHGGEYPDYPKIVDYGTGEHAKLVKRGEYLTKAGDCISCHTNMKGGGEPFAGGLGLETPFGKFYTPNITADDETGIGKWTEDMFIRANHYGLGVYYQNLFPVFPFTSFNKVTRDDLVAIRAYLHAIPKVKKKNRKNDVAFPFNVRLLQWGWKILFFRPAVYEMDPTKSKQWNRGAYLVEGLGHCGECHSPRNVFGATKKKLHLTGGFVDGYYAPDITKYGIKDASDEEVIRVFTEEEKLRGAGKVQGPMKEVDHNSLQYMTHDDLLSMVVYLKSVEGVKHKVKKGNGKVSLVKAKRLYDKFCAGCHMAGTAGAPKLGDVAEWKLRVAEGIDKVYGKAINGWNSMPAKGACMTCSDAEIKKIVDYMVDQSSPGGPKLKMEAGADAGPGLSLAEGKKVYATHCAACHASGQQDAPKLGDKKAWKPIIDKNLDVLFTTAIDRYKLHPATERKGVCPKCSDSDIMSAVKYMVQTSKGEGDYTLW